MNQLLKMSGIGKRKLAALICSRIVLSVLDLVVIALIGLTIESAVQGSYVQGIGLGIALGGNELAIITASLVLLRAALSIITHLSLANEVRRVEISVSTAATEGLLGREPQYRQLWDAGASRFQAASFQGARGVATFIAGGVPAISEIVVILGIAGIVSSLVGPTFLAAAAVLGCLGLPAIIYFLRKTSNAARAYSNDMSLTFAAAMDTYSLRREAILMSRSSYLARRFMDFRVASATSYSTITKLSQVPRLLLENGLFLAILGLIVAVVTSSEVSSFSASSVGTVAVGLLRLTTASVSLQANLILASDGMSQASTLIGLSTSDRRPKNHSLLKIERVRNIDCIRASHLEIRLNGRPILVGEDFEIAKGQVTAIYGASGVGKTSLGEILIGLDRESASGSVKIPDGSRLAFVPQQPHYFLGSVQENILVGRPESYPGQLQELCESLGISHLLERNEKVEAGYLGALNAKLSGGELQRVAIARALVGMPDFIYLDEPTSALDQESSSMVRHILVDSAKRHGTGVLVTTHDQDFRKEADSIFDLKQGRLTRLTES